MNFFRLLILISILSACNQGEVESPKEETKPSTPPAVVTPIPEPTGYSYKMPGANWPFQIMGEEDGSYLKQLKPNTKLVNFELFDADKATIESLKAKGVYVVCYYSLSYEDWRKDINQMPKEAIGKSMSGWAGEKWTDLSKESLHKFFDKRDDLAKSLGCDGVENDNMDDGEKAFKLSKGQLIISNKRRAAYAHNIGLGHFAKNTPDIANDLSKDSDGVFVEEAQKYDEVEPYLVWIKAGKFAAFVEYSKSKCKGIAGAQVQYHPGNEYFDGVNFKVCQ